MSHKNNGTCIILIHINKEKYFTSVENSHKICLSTWKMKPMRHLTSGSSSTHSVFSGTSTNISTSSCVIRVPSVHLNANTIFPSAASQPLHFLQPVNYIPGCPCQPPAELLGGTSCMPCGASSVEGCVISTKANDATMWLCMVVYGLFNSDAHSISWWRNVWPAHNESIVSKVFLHQCVKGKFSIAMA